MKFHWIIFAFVLGGLLAFWKSNQTIAVSSPSRAIVVVPETPSVPQAEAVLPEAQVSPTDRQESQTNSQASLSDNQASLPDSQESSVVTASETTDPKEVSPVPMQTTGSSFKPFYIFSEKNSRQNHYVPSGFMGDWQCISLDDQWVQNCQEGKTCIKIIYDIPCSLKGQQWGGIYWLNPANNWGKRKGGFNLTGAKELTFWAKGEKGGEQIQEITIGGIEQDYPDSDKIVIGPIILTAQWRKYTVDLTDKDLSYLSGGFAWTTEVAVNPESCSFYLDEIKFE